MTGKTIVYLPNWLGDMVMAVPLLESLKAFLKDEIWAIGRTKAIHLYNGHDFFHRFVPYDSNGPEDFIRVCSIIKREGFDRGIILPHSFRSALIFYLSGIRERIGYARNGRGFMLTSSVEEGKDIEPMVEHYLKIIDILGGIRVTDRPRMVIPEDEERKFDELYPDIQRPYICFIPGAEYGSSKCWPVSHFARLADMIVSEYKMKVYILPGLKEEGIAKAIYGMVSRKESVELRSMGIRDLKVCLSKAEAVISNDTGPRHIAAALSVPTIVLLGPMDERYTSYNSPYTHQMVRDVPCRPCNKRRCDRGHECLKLIRPEEVFEGLVGIIGR